MLSPCDHRHVQDLEGEYCPTNEFALQPSLIGYERSST